MNSISRKFVSRWITALSLVMPCATIVRSEEVIITIRLINGRNGKPIKDEDLNVFRDQPHFAENYRADSDGLIKLKIDRESLVSFASNIQITCHEMTEAEKSGQELQQYKVDDILKRGISDTNTCSKKVRIEATPGEFVYFERPRTFWEWMSL